MILLSVILLTSCAASLSNEYQPTAQEIALCSRLFNIDIPTVVYFESEAAGMYYPQIDRISLNSNLTGDSVTVILMHECCHAYQIKVLKRPLESELEYEAVLVQYFVYEYLNGRINESSLKYMRDKMGITF